LKQDRTYRERVIPSACIKVASIEAGITLGWAQITGREGLQFGVDDFGASAPAAKIYEKFGLTSTLIADKIASHRA
jgi:transketolase